MRKSCAQRPNGCAISTRPYGSLTRMAIKAPEFSNATFCAASHRTSAHQCDQFSWEQLPVAWTDCDRLYEEHGMSWWKVEKKKKKTTQFLQHMNEGFSILTTANDVPNKTRSHLQFQFPKRGARHRSFRRSRVSLWPRLNIRSLCEQQVHRCWL